MWEKKQISLAKKFQIIYVDSLSSRRWKTTPHFLNSHSNFFPKSTVMGVKGERSDFALGKSDKHHLSHVSKVKVSGDKS